MASALLASALHPDELWRSATPLRVPCCFCHALGGTVGGTSGFFGASPSAQLSVPAAARAVLSPLCSSIWVCAYSSAAIAYVHDNVGMWQMAWPAGFGVCVCGEWGHLHKEGTGEVL